MGAFCEQLGKTVRMSTTDNTITKLRSGVLDSVAQRLAEAGVTPLTPVPTHPTPNEQPERIAA